MADQADALEQALASLNLRELTGDTKVTACEAAFLIRDGIRVRDKWRKEDSIRQELVDGAVALAKARGWEYDPEDPMMLRYLARKLAHNRVQRREYERLCFSADPETYHYFDEGPLDDWELDLIREDADKLLRLFAEHGGA